MTIALPAEEVAHLMMESVPGAVLDWDDTSVWVVAQDVLEACRFLNEDPDLAFDYLVSISAVDYVEYFEVVYHLLSMAKNHSLVIKTKCMGREDPSVPSVVSVWQGADFQEREIFDLMGVNFPGHPNMKRLMLWEGFPGNPQRKDWLEAPR